MLYPLNINKIITGESENELIFAFNGVITQDLIVSLGETIKGELILYSRPQIVNRVFAVFVEMAQNVMHYSDEKFYCQNNSYGKGLLILVKTSDGFEVITSNKVTEIQKIWLKDHIKTMNNLNTEELKEFYLKTRRTKKFTDTKGAGLGIIDIARRSEKPLSAKFDNVNNSKYLYKLKAIIKNHQSHFVMENLIIKPTKYTPEINFDEKKGVFKINGASYPENAHKFFKPVIKWINDFVKTNNKEIVFYIKMKYYDTSSSKYLIEIFENIEAYYKKGNKVIIRWLYNEDEEDLDSIENSKELFFGLSLPVEFIKE